MSDAATRLREVRPVDQSNLKTRSKLQRRLFDRCHELVRSAHPDLEEVLEGWYEGDRSYGHGSGVSTTDTGSWIGKSR